MPEKRFYFFARTRGCATGARSATKCADRISRGSAIKGASSAINGTPAFSLRRDAGRRRGRARPVGDGQRLRRLGLVAARAGQAGLDTGARAEEFASPRSRLSGASRAQIAELGEGLVGDLFARSQRRVGASGSRRGGARGAARPSVARRGHPRRGTARSGVAWHGVSRRVHNERTANPQHQLVS